MKQIKLKLASVKDQKPTINAKDLNSTSEVILIKFNKTGVYFHLSRNKKTYYANDWKKSYGLPKVGQPLLFNIDEIIYYNQQKLEL